MVKDRLVFGWSEKFFELFDAAFDAKEFVFCSIELNPCSFFELPEFNDFLPDIGYVYHKSPSHLILRNTILKDKCI